jgi:flagellin
MSINQVSLTAGMRANLFALQNTSKMMEATQGRLSTGKRVSSALDDPVNFFAAQGHEQRASDLSFRKDEMSEAIQTVKAADKGISAITTLISAAKSLAQSALSAESTEVSTLQDQFNDILDQIDDLAADSGYKGVNLLDSGSLDVKFDEKGDSKLTLTGFDGSTAADGLSIAQATAWGADDDGIDAINTSIDELDAAKTELRTESKKLSTNLSIITARETFTSQMINTLTDGSGKLTDADLNEEGANMLMLQTQQTLGVNSLSLASQAAQAVLRLF